MWLARNDGRFELDNKLIPTEYSPCWEPEVVEISLRNSPDKVNEEHLIEALPPQTHLPRLLGQL
jgi:hypothetical protein